MPRPIVLPEAAEPLPSSFPVAFSRPTFQRFLVLFVGATVALGRRTVRACPWAARSLAEGHASSYHRVFSRAAWSTKVLGKVLAAAGWCPSAGCSSTTPTALTATNTSTAPTRT